MSTWTKTFRDLLGNEPRSLEMKQYEYCVNEWKSAHEKKMLSNYFLTFLLFIGGLWAVWHGSLFLAVLLLALASNFNRQSSHHILVSEIMESQRLLAMLVNRQHQELESLRAQLDPRGQPSNDQRGNRDL